MNKQTGRLIEMRKPVQRVASETMLREGSTGGLVQTVENSLSTAAKPMRLERVWAVAEVSEISASGRLKQKAPAMEGASALCEAPQLEMAFYRKYTEGMLRRYMKMSMSSGRIPSLLGRELFRGHVSHYRMHTFEDVTIFCLDVERQIERLSVEEKELVKRIALQQYTQMEVAGMMGITLRHCVRRYGATLDHLTELFLAAKLLEPQIMSRG
jgi:hypothetical protein